MKNITDKRDATNMCLKLNKNVFIFSDINEELQPDNIKIQT
jgi:hypothetical protein